MHTYYDAHGKLLTVFGTPLKDAVKQMIDNVMTKPQVIKGAMMGDHHVGYDMPIGGVAVLEHGWVNPGWVGYDIGCGNMAVQTDFNVGSLGGHDRTYITAFMAQIWQQITFGNGPGGLGIDHPILHDPRWQDVPSLTTKSGDNIFDIAADQLGSVGGGNHYVNLFTDPHGWVWVGVHFGSRKMGHMLAEHFIKAAAPTGGLLNTEDDLGEQYWTAMELAGDYAKAGRELVVGKVLEILGYPTVTKTVHNHHNFAWTEHTSGFGLSAVAFGYNVNVIRKGATPAYPDQYGFVGGSMGDTSVILRGVGNLTALNSTVHGAGRVMGRMQAKGKRAKDGTWKREPKVTREMISDWFKNTGVDPVLVGGGVDEAPHVYKRLHKVLEAQGDSIELETVLTPVGVAMAT